jgi:hypothetical protein
MNSILYTTENNEGIENQTKTRVLRILEFMPKNFGQKMLFQNSISGFVNFSDCIFFKSQDKPVKLNATFCEKAKDVCCNVDVWGILINIILQVIITLQRTNNENRKQIFPEKELRSPNFPQS